MSRGKLAYSMSAYSWSCSVVFTVLQPHSSEDEDYPVVRLLESECCVYNISCCRESKSHKPTQTSIIYSIHLKYGYLLHSRSK